MKNLKTIDLNNFASQVRELQDFFTDIWHTQPTRSFAGDSLLGLISEQHKQNFDLWHEEDKAREPNADDAIIAQVKRNIDGLNQHRNDLISEIDVHLAEGLLAAHHNLDQAWNSETIGSIIDRLSIASLRLFHMQEQTERQDASAEHIKNCEDKLERLHQQTEDLAMALQQFIDDVVAGVRQNKLYRQFKMYNDPALNPKIYQSDQN